MTSQPSLTQMQPLEKMKRDYTPRVGDVFNQHFRACICHASPQELMEEYEELREEHYAGQEERHYLTFEKASSKGKNIDFVKRPPAPPPLKPGITVVTGTYALDDVLDYIDWNPFFQVRAIIQVFPCLILLLLLLLLLLAD